MKADVADATRLARSDSPSNPRPPAMMMTETQARAALEDVRTDLRNYTENGVSDTSYLEGKVRALLMVLGEADD